MEREILWKGKAWLVNQFQSTKVFLEVGELFYKINMFAVLQKSAEGK